MTHLVLHIGGPKTGSSAIQANLQAEAKKLRNAGVYIKTPVISHHRFAVEYITSSVRDRSDVQNIRTSSFDEWSSCIEADAAASVVSSEYFTLSDFNLIKDAASAIFSQISVIWYVRPQAVLIASGYNQDVKALGRRTPMTWNARDRHMNWLEQYEHLADVFGVDRVFVFNYDFFRERRLDAYAHFLSILSEVLGFELPSASGVAREENPSLNHLANLLKRAANLGDLKNIGGFIDYVQADPRVPAFGLSETDQAAIRDAFGESNSRLEALVASRGTGNVHGLAKPSLSATGMTDAEALNTLINLLDRYLARGGS